MMNFWSATLFPLNGMVGAGIFALPALLVASVGPFAPWMMLGGAIIVMPLAVVFAILASRYENHGGPLLYSREAFGPFVGFQAGWTRYASGVVSIAANIQIAIAYLAVLFPFLVEAQARQWAAAGFIAFTTIINLVGMRTSVGTLGLMTAIKLLPLIVLAVAGLLVGDPAVGLRLPPLSQFESVVLLTFYALMSFENATILAGEMRNPKRDAPLTVTLTLAAVALLYGLVIWGYLAMGPVSVTSENALAASAGVLAGTTGVVILTGAAAVSIGANSLAAGISLPRLTYAMAEQEMLPSAFAHVSRRFRTPDVSILFFGAAVILFSLLGGFAALAVASTLARLVMYLLTALALPVIERRDATPPRRWHLAAACLAAAVLVWIASQASAESFRMLGMIMLAGGALYLIAAREGVVARRRLSSEQ